MKYVPEYWILENKKAIPTSDVMVWGKFFEGLENRIVAQETLPNGKWVSTVFLGLDHGFGDKVLLFETMVFFNKDDMGELDCKRYETWEEAESGHRKMVKKWSKKND